MTKKTNNTTSLRFSILSLSLLTVMAGAAVAPALGIIQQYFATVQPVLVQMIISIPAIFIVITNLIFPALCRRLPTKTLLMIGLFLYTVGGCVAGLFDHIFLVLAARALVGVGVGIIMPLSTGLLAFYFPAAEQERLMGYSSAMNQMGGVIATLLSGMLATISWRASFLVYGLGLLCILLCGLLLPNEKFRSAEHRKEQPVFTTFRENSSYIIAMFLLMITFFIYPASFALEIKAAGAIPQSYIAAIMAFMDFTAFLGGLLFVRIKHICKKNIRIFAPTLFIIGYLLLAVSDSWIATLLGSLCIGFANGAGIPYLISAAAKKSGKNAATTVMPLLSAALYLAQFITPILLSLIQNFLSETVPHVPYWAAAGTGILLFLWSLRINKTSEQPVIDKTRPA